MGLDQQAVKVGVFCLFPSEMGDIGKREMLPPVLDYGGEKAGIEQKPCFQK